MSTPKEYLYVYERQAWVVDGRYDDCGHPEYMECGCYRRLHAGEQASQQTMDRMNRMNRMKLVSWLAERNKER